MLSCKQVRHGGDHLPEQGDLEWCCLMKGSKASLIQVLFLPCSRHSRQTPIWQSGGQLSPVSWAREEGQKGQTPAALREEVSTPAATRDGRKSRKLGE